MSQDDNQKRLTANGLLSNKQVIIKNFLGGIFWGVGSVIGATAVVAILVQALTLIDFVPIIGDFVSEVIKAVEQNR